MSLGLCFLAWFLPLVVTNHQRQSPMPFYVGERHYADRAGQFRASSINMPESNGGAVIRAMLPVSLPMDHRVIDGPMAVRLMMSLRDRRARPGNLVS